MAMFARVFPAPSREAVVELGKAIDEWPREQKAALFEQFGGDCRERWFYQEIDGKPHVLSVIEAPELEQGYRFLAESTDPFTVWFRAEVAALSGVDLMASPRGPASELLYEFSLT